MTQEEKAKAYDEALKRAIKHRNHDGLTLEQYETIDIIFPELKESKESEDKKIMKEIAEFIYNAGFKPKDIKKKEKWLAWLEKQGEQKPQRMISAEAKEAMYNKPSDKIEPKFKVGDWIVQENIGVYKVIEVCESWYEVVDNKDKHYSIGFDKEYMCHLWTIEDAKEGDVLYHENKYNGIEFIVMNKGINECGNIDSYFRYNSSNGFGIDIPSVLSVKCDNITPATKEQRDLLFQKMHEAGYEWNAEKKELKLLITNGGDFFESENCEQKPAWSEDDEYRLNMCITAIEISYKWDSMVDWLKSLKQRIGG